MKAYSEKKVYIVAVKENEQSYDHVILHVFSSKKLAESYCKHANANPIAGCSLQYYYYFTEKVETYNWWDD